MTCSDGFFQIMNQYPERQVSRQCWKTYNDGVNCPGLRRAPAQRRSPQPAAIPRAAITTSNRPTAARCTACPPTSAGSRPIRRASIIKDDSTGFLGFGRNTVTATSIISDTVWGLALPEIWCNSGGNPLFAFMATALMVAYRDESSYADSLGILGAGPLGGFTPSMVVPMPTASDTWSRPWWTASPGKASRLTAI